MRGYGLPRNDDVANPDIADIQQYGLSKHGYRFHNPVRKAAARRHWKRTARAVAKKEMVNQL